MFLSSDPIEKLEVDPDDIFDLGSLPEDDVIVDLTPGATAKEGKKPNEDSIIKLAAFQCVICMDDVKNLVVTHCGRFSPRQASKIGCGLTTRRSRTP